MLIAAKHVRLLVVRHAATASNLAGRYLGRHDEPLHIDAKPQLQQLRLWLAPESVDVIVHSGSLRTRQTAEGLFVNAPLIEDSRWQGLDYGQWDGLTYQEVLANWADVARAHWADPWAVATPDGETLSQVFERVNAAAHDLVKTYAGHTVLLIGHATPLQLLMCQLLESPLERYWRWKCDLASLSCVDMYPTGTILNWFNRGYQLPPSC